MKSRLTFLAASLLLAGSLHAEPLEVVSSFSILGDVAKQIGGERVHVSTLVGPDADAHAYQLNSADLRKISAAKLILLNGLGLEKADVVRAVQQSKVPFIEASAGITPLKASGHHHHDHDHDHDHDEHDHHHDHGEFDPHVWHDPILMQKYASNIAQALIKADPAGARYYQTRFRQYSQQLVQLDAYARQQFGAIPVARRKVLTGHHAFGYMAKRYNITFLAPQGVSTEAQPSAQTVAEIIRLFAGIYGLNIKDGRMVQRIAQETGARVGGQLYSDALSRGAPAATYADLFRYNVRTISAAMK